MTALFDPQPVALPPVALDRTLGVQVVEWIETYCVHGPGDVQGEAVRLDDEEVAFLLRAYAVGDDGRRVVNRAAYSRSKGRRKSEFAGWIAVAELLAPVRFSHWTDDGFPVGKPVRVPLVKCAATEELQADNVYGVVEFVMRESRTLRDAYRGLDVGRTRVIIPGGGRILPVTSKAASKDGGRESFVTFDETHLYTTDELRALFQVLRRNLTKRKVAEPWSIETTTAFAPGERSIAESAYRTAQAVASGDLSPIGFLYDHREGPALPKTATDAELLEALRLAFGDAAWWQDLDRRLSEFRDPENDWNDCVRYFLNAPATRQRGRWISDEAWKACLDANRVIPQDAEVVVAIDAAHTRDTSACVWTWTAPDGRRVQRSCVWSCIADKPHDVFVAGGRLDNDLVRDFIRDDLASLYRVKLVVGDERYFQDQAHELSEDGFVVLEVAQGSSDMLAAWDQFYGDVVGGESPTLEHDGDAVFAKHVGNAVATKTERGWKVSKAKAVTPIDACAAGAMSAWGSAHADRILDELGAAAGNWRPL